MATADYLFLVVRQGLYLSIVISAPVVLASLLVGLVVSVLQATTQIQEQTLTFAPKLLAVLLALAICGPWMGAELVRFTAMIFDAIPRVR